MTALAKSSPVQPLLPYESGARGLSLAGGVRAGCWVFASGLMSSNFGPSARPLSGEPRWTTEFRSLWERAGEVLRTGGSDLSRMVRGDQFFRDWRAVPFFHEMRRTVCGKHVPPSTSVLIDGLLQPDAGVSMNLVAVAEEGPSIMPVFPERLDLPATSSFVPVMRAGGLVFVAGLMAACKPGDLGGIAPEAKVPEGHLWKGNRIQLEADYLIKKKLVIALEAAGSSLDRVVKADVCIRDISDVPAFNQVWAKAFEGNVPATTFWPTSNPGFAIEDARIEINLVALTGDTKAQRFEVAEAAPAVCDGHPAAIRAGDLLFFSGMIASDANGLVAGARIDPRRPYFGSSIEGQMEHLLSIADAVCRKAGTRLDNTVRIQQAHTDLHELYGACKIWQRRLPGMPLPISAFHVPAPLLVTGCTVQLELWVYAP